jgi:hypothetical protein
MCSKICFLILTLMTGLVTGCFTPEFMPATNIACRVINGETEKPIAGAKLFMVYIGPNAGDSNIRRGPYVTDQNGETHVTVEREVIWGTGSDGFAGGYWRQLEIYAVGYEKTERGEAVEPLEKQAPLIIRLTPFRNRFGAVQVLSHFDSASKDSSVPVHNLLLHVLDGPHAGEQIVLPVMPPDDPGWFVGKKLYLKKSIEQIQGDSKVYLEFNSEEILREGFPNEPYDPDKK